VTISTTLFLLAGVLLNAGAQLLLKAGVSAVGPIHFGASAAWPTLGRVFLQWPVLAGLACYVVNAAAAYWLFGEALGPARCAGIALILLGVFLIART